MNEQVLGVGEWSKELAELLQHAGIAIKLSETNLYISSYSESSVIYEIYCIGYDGELGIRKLGPSPISEVIKTEIFGFMAAGQIRGSGQ